MSAVRIEITQLAHDERGFWTAVVLVAGDPVKVDNRIGFWTLPADPSADHGDVRIVRREVLPPIAEQLRDARLRAERGDFTGDAFWFEPPARTAAPVLNDRPRPRAQRIAEQMAAAGAAAVRRAA